MERALKFRGYTNNRNFAVRTPPPPRYICRTHEDCSIVCAILHVLCLAVDKRDVSMDASYRRKLQALLDKGRPLSLPQLFLRGKRVDEAEEVR